MIGKSADGLFLWLSIRVSNKAAVRIDNAKELRAKEGLRQFCEGINSKAKR